MNINQNEELLSNIDLTYLCQLFGIKLNGIYFTKGLKDVGVIIKNGSYIFNLSPDTNEGVHWVACFVKDNRVAYCDSFGAPASQDIIDFIKRKKNLQLIYNPINNQYIKDSSCGWFVLAFLHYFTQYKNINYNTLHDFNKLFVENTKYNIVYLKNYIKNILPANYI